MFPSKPEEVVTVDVSQAKALLQSDHQYLDVRCALLSHHHYVQVTKFKLLISTCRTEEEFRRGHCLAPKILNVPYMLNTPQGRVKNPKFLDQVSSLLSPTDDILVGCQSGARSFNATSELVAAGYKKVRNVGGGYLAWVDQNFPINKEQQQSAN
ncbi:thiosulfate sulfurtransferase 18 isoform X1 [Raphanus sativus]|uniref:Thiosulfate sulfurtransferase 18 isoform X1 n=1 Tax=Raphanus sativus TaxID=3726 RepID=A0A9W3BYL9_RAPSA|nr:thiosulfate sulfurtransferase 18 isoform X1 [Raphanus sativus]